jgi:hypothetical protein
MIYLLAYQLSDGTKALAVSDLVFVGSENLEEAKKLVPNWNGYHKADITWSASATLYYASFHPCIVAFNSYDDVDAILIKDSEGNSQMTYKREIWGSARYTVIKKEPQWNVVFDPQLIDQGFNIAQPFYED